MYNRPWPRWVPFAILMLLAGVLGAVQLTLGFRSPAIWIILLFGAIILVAFVILDPEVTIKSHKKLPDGRVVTVRRPIVGFKKYERAVGVTVGYEVRVDGFRYEEAYFRI